MIEDIIKGMYLVAYFFLSFIQERNIFFLPVEIKPTNRLTVIILIQIHSVVFSMYGKQAKSTIIFRVLNRVSKMAVTRS